MQSQLKTKIARRILLVSAVEIIRANMAAHTKNMYINCTYIIETHIYI